MSYGILSFGAYVPSLRLDRKAVFQAVGWAAPNLKGLATGERSVANWDEDAITMAVESGLDCLANTEFTIPHVSMVSTTFPFSDRSNSGLVADALNLQRAIATEDFGGSRRAGTSALARALTHSESTLMIASDCREAKPASTQEMTYGHGSACVLLGEGKPIAKFLSSASEHEDLIDQYRASGIEYDYSLEERWVKEEGWLKIAPDAMQGAALKAGIELKDVDHFVVHGNGGAVAAVAKKLGLDRSRFSDDLRDTCGDTGAAHPFLMLSNTLSNAGADEIIMLVGFGQGVDALLLRTTDHLSKARKGRGTERFMNRRRSTVNYTFYLSLRERLSLDFGLRAERDNRTSLSAFYRKRRDINSMLGGRCNSCDALQYPRSVICVSCGTSNSQAEESLAGLTGRVKSFTEDWLAYTPSPPYIYGNIEFEGGANVMLEFTDFEPGNISAGDKVRLVFRVKDRDEKRKFHRYFWKPAPLTRS
jgi:hydroxymethylglutaryl-CoA synthase